MPHFTTAPPRVLTPPAAGPPPIRVALADDHPIVLSATQSFLELYDDIHVVGVCGSGRSALGLLQQQPVDVLVLDLMMPSGNGLEVLRSLKARWPGCGVLIFSGQPADVYALNTIRAGASGYLSKGVDPERIVEAVRVAAQGRRYISAEVAELMARCLERPHRSAAAHEELSQRELQVFLRLAEGKATQEVAALLCITTKAVSTYRRRLLDKLQLNSNSALTRYAMQHQLIGSESTAATAA